MRKFQLFLILATGLMLALPANALDVRTRGIRNPAIFGIEFPGEARSYHAREGSVIAISKQEYVTAAFRVLELNILTEGSALLRIYYSRALKPGELAGALGRGSRASGIPGSSIIQAPLPPQIEAMATRSSNIADEITGQTVIKEYPLATHAKTFEFRVTSRKELLDLHDALKKHWFKEPAYYEDGQIVQPDGETQLRMKPRRLGGTLFKVQDS